MPGSEEYYVPNSGPSAQGIINGKFVCPFPNCEYQCRTDNGIRYHISGWHEDRSFIPLEFYYQDIYGAKHKCDHMVFCDKCLLPFRRQKFKSHCNNCFGFQSPTALPSRSYLQTDDPVPVAKPKAMCALPSAPSSSPSSSIYLAATEVEEDPPLSSFMKPQVSSSTTSSMEDLVDSIPSHDLFDPLPPLVPSFDP